ncbi:MAG: UDP-N-acetylmuramoyl-tripeptide--D-alanyl-D-alanine ligase, partial [Firmicutes bacterium]|nr:UDP-N-acetylmuramoyl-tripeptide--D-alanyl-D-alanine ligase [Bacillota bacterium]
MSCKAAATAVNGEIITAADQEAQIERIVIDSRDVRAGDFFVPLAGEHTDGHRFVTMAAQKGAVGCFINRTAELDPPSNICVIVVDDTLAALQTLAHAYRLQFTLPVVGVTGSVGKTTTKDLLGAVLAARFKVLKTAGNLNNQIGLPIMLSRLDKNVQVAVLEMGMSGFGEIDLLARLAAPLVGVITNIGESHLEMLGSRAGIARAKCELLQHLPAAGAAVVNADEPLLEPYLKDLACKVISFGFTSTATLRCTAITTADTHKQKVQLEQVDYPPLLLEPPLPGRHNIYNLMAAVAVARELGIEDDEIQAGLGHIEMSEMRLEMVSLP